MNPAEPDDPAEQKPRRRYAPAAELSERAGRVLLAGTIAAIVAGVAAFVMADSTILGRIGSAAFALLVVYGAATMLAWSIDRRALNVIFPGGGGLKNTASNEDTRNVQRALDDYEAMRKRAEAAERSINTTADALTASNESLQSIAKENERLKQENAALRAERGQTQDRAVRRGTPEG